MVGASSIVKPSELLLCERGALCRDTAADSTWPPSPSVSVATTVRTTLPAVALTASEHVGKKHRSLLRKFASTVSAFAVYSSIVPDAFNTTVTAVPVTVSLVAPGGNGGGGGGDGVTLAAASIGGAAVTTGRT